MRQALAICSLVGVLAVPTEVGAMFFGDSGGPCTSQETMVRGGYTQRVREGDTLSDIAKRVYGDEGHYALIARVNGIKNPDLIHPGQVLTLPKELHFGPSRSVPCGYVPRTPAHPYHGFFL